MAADISFGGKSDRTLQERQPQEPSDGTIPTGTDQFKTGPGVALGGNGTSETIQPGTSVSGRIHRDNKFVSGRITIVYDGFEVNSLEPGRAGYFLSSLPPGSYLGENAPPGERYVQFEGEDGSIASKDLQGPNTEWNVSFGELNVLVEDADGNPVADSKVIIDNKEFSTDGNGKIEVGAAGTTDLEALLGTDVRQIEVPESGTESVNFQFTGVKGKLRTPTGGAISNATITLTSQSGAVLAKQETDGSGRFRFEEVPLRIPVSLTADPFQRDFESGGPGQVVLKNLPFETDDVAAAEVTVEDSNSGKPVANVPASIVDGDFAALSTTEGKAAVLATVEGGETVEREIVLGEDDQRYKTTRATVSLVGGETVEIEAELQRRPALTNR